MAQVYQLIPLPQGPFAKLSLLERALYGLLYDRCKMSVNNMLNGNGRFYDEHLEEVYCVYNQNDLAKTLGVSVRTVRRATATWLTTSLSALQSHAFRIATVTTCPIISGNGCKQNNSAIMSFQFGHFVRPIRPFCPLYSAILSPLFGQNGRLFYIRNLIRVHCTPESRWCHHYARARVYARAYARAP